MVLSLQETFPTLVKDNRDLDQFQEVSIIAIVPWAIS